MFEYLWAVWRAIGLGMNFEPSVVQIVETYPNAFWIAFGVVMVAGISLLLGQSVMLFLNQVTPRRFAMSLVINGLLLVAGWAVWASAVWIIGTWLFDEAPPFATVLKLIGLSYAPLAYGFLILMPYAGPFISRLLYAWSFIIALQAVIFTFNASFWAALVCVGLGWLLIMVLSSTIGRPVVALQNWIWLRTTGMQANATAHELSAQFSGIEAAKDKSQGPSKPPAAGGKS
jgi:hypothetical protein